MDWTINDTLTIRFDLPAQFRVDAHPLPPVNACDQANGLWLLERWSVENELTPTGLSVQTNPGNASPLLSRTEFSDKIERPDATWYLWNAGTVHQTGKPANRGLAVLGDYLLMVHGSPEAMRAIVENVTIKLGP